MSIKAKVILMVFYLFVETIHAKLTLQNAATQCNATQLKQLVEEGSNIWQLNKKGQTALHVAALHCPLQEFIKIYTIFNHYFEQHYPTKEEAQEKFNAFCRHKDRLGLSGAEVALSKFLDFFIEQDDTEQIQELLKNSDNDTATLSSQDTTPIDITGALNYKRSTGTSHLHLAAQKASFENVIFIASGAAQAFTVTYRNKKKAQKAFLAYVNAQDISGKTALHYILERGTKPRYLESLITDLQFNPTIKDKQGISPLRIALEGGKAQLGVFLVIISSPHIKAKDKNKFVNDQIEKALEASNNEEPDSNAIELMLGVPNITLTKNNKRKLRKAYELYMDEVVQNSAYNLARYLLQFPTTDLDVKTESGRDLLDTAIALSKTQDPRGQMLEVLLASPRLRVTKEQERQIRKLFKPDHPVTQALNEHIRLSGPSIGKALSPLCIAVIDQDHKTAEALLKQGANPNISYEGKRLLPYTIDTYDYEMTLLLLSSPHLNINRQDAHRIQKEFPIHGEVINPINEKIITTLKQRMQKKLGSQGNYKPHRPQSLHKPGQLGHIRKPSAALHAAIAHNDMQQARKLLTHGIDPNARIKGKTPLHLAIGFNRPHFVHLLLTSSIIVVPNEAITIIKKRFGRDKKIMQALNRYVETRNKRLTNQRTFKKQTVSARDAYNRNVKHKQRNKNAKNQTQRNRNNRQHL